MNTFAAGLWIAQRTIGRVRYIVINKMTLPLRFILKLPDC